MEAGHSVLFAPAYRLVQELLAAKRDLDLPRRLRKLDNFDFLLLDDLGYLPQGAEESEVLFTLIAERYERRSLGVTSNLVFSEWEHIFANPMATAAAIDRVIHHSVILEFDPRPVPSWPSSPPTQLPHRCSPATGPGRGGEPAKLIDAKLANMVDAGQSGLVKPSAGVGDSLKGDSSGGRLRVRPATVWHASREDGAPQGRWYPSQGMAGPEGGWIASRHPMTACCDPAARLS